MSSITSALTGGGGSGMGFRAQGADLIKPVTPEDLLQSQAGVTGGLGQQEAFLKALQAQNGLGNQSSVFNQQQNIANGTGPNPAQAMLAQSTGANVANQAALMAGQRGSSQNAGMIARQAAQQGAGIQQNAAGQGAALQAQQSLNALGQMGGLATNQANQQSNATNAFAQNNLAAQQNQLGAVGAYNNANVGMQSNINNANAGLAGNVAGQQGNMMGNMMGGIGSIGQMFSGGGGDATFAGQNADLFASVPDAASALAEGGAVEQADQSTIGGFLKHVFTENPSTVSNPNAKQAPAPPKDAADKFKQSGHFADGGGITPLDSSSSPQSNVGRSFMAQQDQLGAPDFSPPPQAAPAKGGGGDPMGAAMGQGMQMGQALWKDFGKFGNWINQGLDTFGSGASEFGSGFEAAMPAAMAESGPMWAGAAEEMAPAAVMVAAQGGQVPAMVSPGENYLDKADVEKVKKGANPMEVGEKIPGKPKIKGAKNDYANDTVPKTLEEGGIVLPRSVTQSKHPQWAAHKFVAAILKEQALKKGK